MQINNIKVKELFYQSTFTILNWALGTFNTKIKLRMDAFVFTKNKSLPRTVLQTLEKE